VVKIYELPNNEALTETTDNLVQSAGFSQANLEASLESDGSTIDTESLI
jgi:hypothetical protein